MIGGLRGVLARKGLPNIELDVCGVIYEVRVSLSTLERLPAEGESAYLQIHTLVKPDAIDLYGFLARQEKELFIQLLGVSGVGPRTALVLLSSLTTAELVTAIRADQPKDLEKVPGIGRKTAQRLIVELKDKFEKWHGISEPALSDSRLSVKDDAIAALEGLGYKRSEAERVLAGHHDGQELSVVIRSALRELGALR